MANNGTYTNLIQNLLVETQKSFIESHRIASNKIESSTNARETEKTKQINENVLF